MSQQPLRIFVAMPGTDMGANASYADPEAVKANLLTPVVDKLRSRLGREVELVIEKDKRKAGVIHQSMFAEARDADIYIADLTGANPNVYLELGVRWALRDNVTILISQSVADLKFNVFANRAILYYPDVIIKAAEDVVEAIEAGLVGTQSDSPVRTNSDYLTIPKEEFKDLHARIDQLKQERGEELLNLARGVDDTVQQIALLRNVISVNPASTQARIALGIALRSVAEYSEAIEHFRSAVRLEPDNPEVHRELGVTYNKAGEPELAVKELRRTVAIDATDPEAWSNLGGALRRIGMASASVGYYDRAALLESRDSYAAAHKLEEFNLYAALNVARLDILLSKWEDDRFAQGKEEFAREVYLCRHTVQQRPRDWWRKFDLGDALLFSGSIDEARSTYVDAVNLVPEDERSDVFVSVLGPMQDLVTAKVLEGQLLAAVIDLISLLE